MLKGNEKIEKYHKKAEEFRRLMEQEKYCAAKWCFTAAVMTAGFIEMDKEHIVKLFGENGLFNQELAREAFRKAGGDCADG